jgi:PAS domain S-box-containing protein
MGRRKDGVEFPAEVSLLALEVGGEVMASATVRDVSGRVATERALSESEERFRVAFELSPVAMALVDMEGRCASANLALSEQSGYPVEALVGRPMTDLVHGDDLAVLVEGLNQVLSGTSPVARMELRQPGADGTLRMVDLSLALVVDGEGSPQYTIGQSLDITERVESQARLEEMLDSKNQLIASVSHELRTPLTVLVGYARLLHDDTGLLSPKERSEMIAAIVRESAELTNIVEDLVVAAKGETGDLAVVQVPVDLRAQVAQVLEAWDKTTVDHIGVVGTRLVGLGDPGRVRQILRNLVSNALRYGGENLVIQIFGDPATVRVAVGDDGETISEEDQERIFQPYQRAHEAVGVTPSMGFGLAVSRQLAQLMAGHLRYHRRDDMNVFELTLPAAPDPPAGPPRNPRS